MDPWGQVEERVRRMAPYADEVIKGKAITIITCKFMYCISWLVELLERQGSKTRVDVCRDLRIDYKAYNTYHIKVYKYRDLRLKLVAEDGVVWKEVKGWSSKSRYVPPPNTVDPCDELQLPEPTADCHPEGTMWAFKRAFAPVARLYEVIKGLPEGSVMRIVGLDEEEEEEQGVVEPPTGLVTDGGLGRRGRDKAMNDEQRRIKELTDIQTIKTEMRAVLPIKSIRVTPIAPQGCTDTRMSNSLAPVALVYHATKKTSADSIERIGFNDAKAGCYGNDGGQEKHFFWAPSGKIAHVWRREEEVRQGDVESESELVCHMIVGEWVMATTVPMKLSGCTGGTLKCPVVCKDYIVPTYRVEYVLEDGAELQATFPAELAHVTADKKSALEAAPDMLLERVFLESLFILRHKRMVTPNFLSAFRS